jgi:hypothetical protein
MNAPLMLMGQAVSAHPGEMTADMKHNNSSRDDQPAVARNFSVDPFHDNDEHGSRISGVAREASPPFDAYVFRSVPIEVPKGQFRFTLTLPGLKAGNQIMLIEVINRSSAAGNSWSRLKVQGVHLSDIAGNGNSWSIEVDGWPNVQYVCAGYIHDEGEVTADALNLFVDTQFTPVQKRKKASDKPNPKAVKSAEVAVRPRVTSPQPPSFSHPSSQPWSLPQTREPEFREKLLELGHANSDPASPWTWADPIILQVFERYRVCSRGSRGLGIDIEDFALAGRLLERGCALTCLRVDPDFETCLDVGADIEQLADMYPDHRANILRAASISMVHSESFADDIDASFDFAWWTAPRSVSRLNVQGILRSGMNCLLPGGIMAMVLPFAREAQPGTDDGGPLVRTDIERLTLDTISHGHDVAQLRFNVPQDESADAILPFVLIARRGDD